MKGKNFDVLPNFVQTKPSMNNSHVPKNKSYIWEFVMLVFLIFVLQLNYGVRLKLSSFNLTILIVWIFIIWWISFKKEIALEFNLRVIFVGATVGLCLAAFGILFLNVDILLGTFDKDTRLLELIIYTLQKSIAEEFVFRLILVDYLKKIRISVVSTIIIQGLVFGLLHYFRYQHYIFGVLFAVIIGWLLGVLRVSQRNLLGAITAHSVINAVYLFYWYRGFGFF